MEAAAESKEENNADNSGAEGALSSDSVFESMQEAKLALKYFCTTKRAPCTVKESRPKRFHMVCQDENCHFEVACNARTNGRVYITRFKDTHSCSAGLEGKVQKIPSDYIFHKLAKKIGDDVNIQVSSIQAAAAREDGIVVPYMTTWRGKRKAIQAFRAKQDRDLGKLPAYFTRLEEAMPGTKTKVELDENNSFVRAFLCPKPCQRAFLHCLPIIELDSCPINNEFRGVVMAACSVDGAGELVPIAYAIAPVDDSDNWDWFVLQLRMAVPEVNLSERPVVVISDRENGMYNAVVTHLTECRHCFCVNHIEKRLKTMFKVNFGAKLRNAAKTTSLQVFKQKMEEMAHSHPAAHEYLNSIDKGAWTCLYSTLPKYGRVTSEIADCFNSWIEEVRGQSHFSIIVWITRKIMGLFFDRKSKYASMTSPVPRELEESLNDAMEKAGRCTCHPASSTEFLVCSGVEEFTVNLEKKNCSCGHFTDMKWPCYHAAAAIGHVKQSCLEYVDDAFKKAALISVYNDPIAAVTTSNLEGSEILPPAVRNQPGRPKTNRIRKRSDLEPENSTIVCSRCHERGHNKLTCERRQKGVRIEPH